MAIRKILETYNERLRNVREGWVLFPLFSLIFKQILAFEHHLEEIPLATHAKIFVKLAIENLRQFSQREKMS